VEKLLAVIFGGAAVESPVEKLPAQLRSSLAELRGKLDSYERVVK
jgi:hypothetical protein